MKQKELNSWTENKINSNFQSLQKDNVNNIKKNKLQTEDLKKTQKVNYNIQISQKNKINFLTSAQNKNMNFYPYNENLAVVLREALKHSLPIRRMQAKPPQLRQKVSLV